MDWEKRHVLMALAAGVVIVALAGGWWWCCDLFAPLRVRQTIGGYEFWFGSVAFSADSRTLATWSVLDPRDAWRLGEARLWDVASGESRSAYRADTHGETSIALSPDGRTLVVASSEPRVFVWDVHRRELRKCLSGRRDAVANVPPAISPDCSTVVVPCEGGRLCVWDLNSGLEVGVLRTDDDDEFISVAFSPDGRLLAAGKWRVFGARSPILIWELGKRAVFGTLPGHESGVTNVVFSPDGRYLASTSFNRSAKLWDLRSGQEKLSLAQHSEYVNCLAFSPSGKTLVSGSDCTAYRFWSFLPPLDNFLGGSAFFAGEIKICEVGTGQEQATVVDRSQGSVEELAVSPDGRFLCTGSQRGGIKLWDVRGFE